MELLKNINKVNLLISIQIFLYYCAVLLIKLLNFGGLTLVLLHWWKVDGFWAEESISIRCSRNTSLRAQE